MTETKEIFARYANYFDTLLPNTVARLKDLAAEDLHFKDPFNDLHTIDSAIRLFEEMFEETINPRFEVTHIAACDSTAFLRWNFTFTPKSALLNVREPWKIVGVSEVRCNAEGKIIEHIDHWDSGRYFYERLPLFGSVVRLIRRRMASS